MSDAGNVTIAGSRSRRAWRKAATFAARWSWLRHGQKVLENIPGFASYWDVELRCQFASPAYQEWFGRTKDALVGVDMREVLGETLFALNEPHVRAALAGERRQFERSLTNSLGETRHFLVNFVPDVASGKVVGFISRTSDVTALKHTEAALRAEAEKREQEHKLLVATAQSLRVAQKLGQIGSWEWRITEDVITWSDQLYRILGYDPAIPLPEFAEREGLYTPESWLRLSAAISRTSRTEEPFLLELEFKTKGGRHGWVETRGEAARDDSGNLKILGTVQDITQRKKTEKALSDSELQTRLMFDSIQDHAIIMLDAGGCVISWNSSAERLTSYRRDEIVGRHFSQFYPPEDVANGKPHRELIVAAEQGRVEDEGWQVRKDGTRVAVNTIINAVKDARGELQGFVKVTRDITERKEAIEALEQARDAAEAANRTKSEFLAVMSHEIRTPMNGLMGMNALLLDTELSQQQREMAETIRYSADSLLTVIDDVLDISKLEAGKFDIEEIDFDLASLMKRATDLLAPRAAENSLSFNVDMTGVSHTALRGDPTRLRQILLNLLSNAIKFTQEGGVTTTISATEVAPARSRVRCEVADTGPGLNEDVKQRLFKPFAQADKSVARRFGGTGLGLSICKKLIGLMGGEIGVADRSGGGSVFWFEVDLPHAAADFNDRRQKKTEGGRKTTEVHSGRILLAEDNRVNIAIATRILELAGYMVDVALDWAEAIAALQLNNYDLVLMDVQMPKIDGLSATRQIRAMEQGGGRTPIVGLTANAMREDQRRCIDAGMDDYLSKPFKPAMLVETVARWIELS